MKRTHRLSKKDFIAKVISMDFPVLEEKSDEYRVLMNYYWLISDKANWRNFIETPSVRLTNAEYRNKEQEKFDRRLEETRKKYKIWLDEAIATKQEAQS